MEREEDRNAVIRDYADWFYRRVDTDRAFRALVEAVRGKTLVCHCKPRACHGDVIVEYLTVMEAP